MHIQVNQAITFEKENDSLGMAQSESRHSSHGKPMESPIEDFAQEIKKI